MSRINKIIKVLKEKNIFGYLINEEIEDSYEQYYVKGLLETVRRINDTLDKVTVYVKNECDGKETIGEADFIISHDISSSEISSLCDGAIDKAKNVNNEMFELVKGNGKKSAGYKALAETPDAILQNIAGIFFAETGENTKFNSLECFFKEKTVIAVNSSGVNLKKKTFEINVEAIPSYYGENVKTELYRMFKYDRVDYDKIREDAKNALSDVVKRGYAEKVKEIGSCDILLRGENIYNLFDELISTYSYGAVYTDANLHKTGDDIQNDPYEKINLSLAKKSSSDFFDSDGVILKETKIIEDGKLASYYGTSRFAQYLGLEPTGDLPKIILKAGKKSVSSLKKKPYIEITDLSGIQADVFAGYLGGEVRLAIYFDGKDYHPISGFSFSTNITDAINHMYFSKEKEQIMDYEGPKMIRIENVKIL